MLSTYGANLYVNVIVGRATPPDTLYLALLSMTPDVNDDGSTITVFEPTAVDYVRQPVYMMGVGYWTDASSGTSIYAGSYVWEPATDWGVYTSYALCDQQALGTGNMIMFGNIGAGIVFAGGSLVRVPGSTFSIQAV